MVERLMKGGHRWLATLFSLPKTVLAALEGTFIEGLFSDFVRLMQGVFTIYEQPADLPGPVDNVTGAEEEPVRDSANHYRLVILVPWMVVGRTISIFKQNVVVPVSRFSSLSLRTFLAWLASDFLVAVWRKSKVLFRSTWRFVNYYAVRLWYRLPLPERINERARVRSRLQSMLQEPYPTGMRTGQRKVSIREERRLPIKHFTTALVTTGVVLFVGFLTSQGDSNDMTEVFSQKVLAQFPPTPTLLANPTFTPSPTPTMTPPPTATPTPTSTAAAEIDVEAWPLQDPMSSGGSVVFTIRENGNDDIYALTVGRPNPLRLTTNPAEDRDPEWNNDGTKIAFSSRRDGNWEIYVLDLRLNKVVRITRDLDYDGAPSWSPDGMWLVYESYNQGNMDLFIISSDGEGQPIRLTENRAHDFSPAWSSDGRHIAFASQRQGNKDIYIMSLDRPSDDSAYNVTNSPEVLEDNPAFSTDGSYLAFDEYSSGRNIIGVLALDNYQPAGEIVGIGQGSYPSWSSEAQSLVYVHRNGLQSFIIASGIDAWSVAPQAFSHEGLIDYLDWTGIVLPFGLEQRYEPTGELTEEPLFSEQESADIESAAAYLLREIDIEAPAPYLSDRVDDSFRALRKRIIDEAGWDFLGQVDNMFSYLTSKPYPGEAEKNWNKAARAFDFYYRFPISVDPQVEIVREDIGHQTFWRVYLRTAIQDGTQGEPLRDYPWDFTARYGIDPSYYDEGGKYKDEIPEGYYIDFTQLAADYGWSRVPSLENWRTFYQGIRYWHFENRGQMDWEQAILELYSSDEFTQVFGQP